MVLWPTKYTELFWLENNMATVKWKHGKGYRCTHNLCSRALQMNSTHEENEYGGQRTGSSYNSQATKIVLRSMFRWSQHPQ
jgi:hypothetical protein